MKYAINLLFIFIIFSCSTVDERENSNMQEKLRYDLQTISEARVFFGHQSVGQNIINGIEDIVHQIDNVKLNILKDTNVSDLPEYYLLHSRIGHNEKPKTKCDSFLEFSNTTFAENLDIAIMKFCYIDFNSSTDVDVLFTYYTDTIQKIKDQHPSLKIIHTTVPLETEPSLFKVFLKKILGRENLTTIANIKRNEYNAKLSTAYKNEPIFDLAKVESTYGDGSRETFSQNEIEYFSLIEEYTNDGGHLNKLGRSLAAKELISILSKTLESRSKSKN